MYIVVFYRNAMKDESLDVEEYQKKVSEAIDGGGCAETWRALHEIRNQAQSIPTNRRSFLRRAASGIGVGFGTINGASGPAFGEKNGEQRLQQMKEAAEVYTDPDAVRDELWNQSDELLHELESYGYGMDQIVSRAATAEVLTLETYGRSNTGTVVYGTMLGDTAAAEIRSTVAVEEGRLTLSVRPKDDARYAVLKPTGASPSEYTILNPQSDKKTMESQSVSAHDPAFIGTVCQWVCGPVGGTCPVCAGFTIECGLDGSCTVLESGNGECTQSDCCPGFDVPECTNHPCYTNPCI